MSHDFSKLAFSEIAVTIFDIIEFLWYILFLLLYVTLKSAPLIFCWPSEIAQDLRIHTAQKQQKWNPSDVSIIIVVANRRIPTNTENESNNQACPPSLPDYHHSLRLYGCHLNTLCFWKLFTIPSSFFTIHWYCSHKPIIFHLPISCITMSEFSWLNFVSKIKHCLKTW